MAEGDGEDGRESPASDRRWTQAEPQRWIGLISKTNVEVTAHGFKKFKSKTTIVTTITRQFWENLGKFGMTSVRKFTAWKTSHGEA